MRDDHPVPKIIDFGVAKAITQSLTDRTLYTEFGVLIGTPEYTSPEQAEMTGLDIDMRTDVYALGVILYAEAEAQYLDLIGTETRALGDRHPTTARSQARPRRNVRQAAAVP